ncbi:MAG: hypothetical protein JWR24_647 [Actinoallomurus sp.]|nr:hypothetical protein [Actinoallomurus sp.]
MNKKALGGVSALAIGVVGTGVYLAVPASAGASNGTATTASTQHAKQNGKQNGKHLLRGIGVHGQATVRTKKGFAQVSWQRGLLTGKSGGTLTVRSLDGTTWQWTTDAKTRVRKDGQKSDLGTLAVHDFVFVAGADGANGSRTAKRVIVPKKVPANATQSPAPAHS